MKGLTRTVGHLSTKGRTDVCNSCMWFILLRKDLIVVKLVFSAAQIEHLHQSLPFFFFLSFSVFPLFLFGWTWWGHCMFVCVLSSSLNSQLSCFCHRIDVGQRKHWPQETKKVKHCPAEGLIRWIQYLNFVYFLLIHICVVYLRHSIGWCVPMWTSLKCHDFRHLSQCVVHAVTYSLGMFYNLLWKLKCSDFDYSVFEQVPLYFSFGLF